MALFSVFSFPPLWPFPRLLFSNGSPSILARMGHNSYSGNVVLLAARGSLLVIFPPHPPRDPPPPFAATTPLWPASASDQYIVGHTNPLRLNPEQPLISAKGGSPVSRRALFVSLLHALFCL